MGAFDDQHFWPIFLLTQHERHGSTSLRVECENGTAR
jgi:hypothetical protein